jgi:hypothetical protein
MKRVLLIGDSFGCQRVHGNNVTVAEEDTWPNLVIKQFCELGIGIEIEADFEPFRLLDEVLDIIDHKLTIECYDFVVVQAGLVDAFPRPLPRNAFRSRTFMLRVLRRMVRFVRLLWLKYLYCKPMVESGFLLEKCLQITTKHSATRFLFTQLTRQIHKEALKTPRQAEAILDLNQQLVRLSSIQNNVDMYQFDQRFDETLLEKIDSHFSLKGNRYFSDRITNWLQRELESDKVE